MTLKRLQLLLTLVVLTGMLGVTLTAQAAPPIDYRPVDVGPEIRQWPATPQMILLPPEGLSGEVAGGSQAMSLSDCTLDEKLFLSLDNYRGYYFFTTFYLLAEDGLGQVWVQANLSWPAGDSRATPEVTCEQAQYMLAEFSNTIYPREIAFFGEPNFHDGSYSLLEAWGYMPPGYYADEGARQIILVSNVRDDNYYDPAYPFYIAGFYSPSFEAYFDRNVITIDAYDWANRTGPDAARPYLYEGTVAHEYQHLLHDDYDSDEETWVNEGMSDFAEYLCGYGHPQGHVDFSAEHPENSLVVWGDQGGLEILADYGHAYLWTLYLSERFGQGFIQSLFRNPANGIAGVNDTLSAHRVPKRFADLYADWSVQLLINAKTPGGGRYQFGDLEFALDIGTPEAPNPEAYDTPGAPPWGTDYIWIHGNPRDLARLTFNGVAYSTFPTGWSSDGEVLWSGTGDLVDNWAIFPATGGGTLTFDTNYDIEKAWDFGFVQVSTDGGYNWTSLASAYSTPDHDPSAHPKVVENLPGLTGSSGGWVNMSYGLSAYAGQEILIAFRYVTDWATTEAGWYIDNVYVDDTLISDGSSAELFQDLTELLPINNDFAVTFVGIKEVGKGKGNQYRVLTLKLDEVTEEGLLQLSKVLKDSTSAVMLVTFEAPEGFSQYAQYSYEFSYTNKGPKK